MTKKRFHAWSGVRRWSALLAAVTGVAMTGIAVTGATALPANGQEDQLHRYEHQAIAWHDCRTNPNDPDGADLADVGAVCGELTVPLDYRHPDGRTISMAVDRRPATDTAHRLGTLFVPSRSLIAQMAAGSAQSPLGAPALAARYDLVSLDPRFLGLSAPLNCGWPVNLGLRLGTASLDRAAFDTHVALARRLASLCAKDADVLPFASSRNVARDTDILRSALGEHRISYLGWSYSGYLGAVYVQMFGRHVDRMVLDSAPDPNTYGPRFDSDSAPAAMAALEHWAGWAAQRDAQYHLGTSTASVLHTIPVISDSARRRPLRVGDLVVTADMLPVLVDRNKDDSDRAYAGLSVDVGVLRDAANGLAVTPSPQLASTLSRFSNPAVVASDHSSASTANRCADRAAPRDPEFYWHDIQDHLATEPFYGPVYRSINPCAFWPTTPIEPPTTIDNHHPLLMVGGTGDATVPYAGQLVMHRALHRSRLVTLNGSFHHIQYLFVGNACVDNTVQGYLLGGPLPSHDLTCRRG
jgi:pimeloyl-ACP methyl ester carboxylesterase